MTQPHNEQPLEGLRDLPGLKAAMQDASIAMMTPKAVEVMCDGLMAALELALTYRAHCDASVPASIMERLEPFLPEGRNDV